MVNIFVFVSNSGKNLLNIGFIAKSGRCLKRPNSITFDNNGMWNRKRENNATDTNVM